MSRRAFRSQVDAPRPTSAWVLVTVASATLWITEQLDAWVMAVQALVIVGTLLRRTQPFPWQSSPIVLNVGMFGIVGVTIAVALRGGPSTIALAHFSALTQALQLFDARPRRTEFLLVALALFQVILASNLTDSVFFPPLLFVFLLSVTWTLLVHTLRSEAIEAGVAQGVTRAITPGLLRTTLLASAVSVVLALLLFVLLPRLRGTMVQGSILSPTLATAGFSDNVSLGDLGRIRHDSTIVMRVETLQGEPPPAPAAYWRGLAFDHFDGRSWSISPSRHTIVPGSPEGGVSLGPERVNLVQRIVRDPVEAGVLFTLGEPRGLQGTVRRLKRDGNGGLYALGQDHDRVRYTVGTLRVGWDDDDLRDDAVSVPRGGDRYLQLPALSPRVAELAGALTAGLDDDASRVRALERHLLDHGRYSDTPPAVDPEAAVSPVETFLFGELAAHCEYFASAMVVLARSAGIPARLVNGFAGGQENSIGGFVELTRSDAHSWVEVHYADAGWVRYDPTPGTLRARVLPALSLAERLRMLASTIELWWFQRVVDFDRADQMQALRRAYFAWKRSWRPQEARPALPSGSTPWRFEGDVAWREGLATAAAAAALASLALAWRRRRRTRTEVPGFYTEALRLLARRGFTRERSATARAFSRQMAEALPAGPATAFEALTEAYLAERFGGHRARNAASRLRALRDGLHRRR